MSNSLFIQHSKCSYISEENITKGYKFTLFFKNSDIIRIYSKDSQVIFNHLFQVIPRDTQPAPSGSSFVRSIPQQLSFLHHIMISFLRIALYKNHIDPISLNTHFLYCSIASSTSEAVPEGMLKTLWASSF